MAKTIFIIQAVIIGILVGGGVFYAFSSLITGTDWLFWLFEIYNFSDIGLVEIAPIILVAICIIIVAAVIFIIGFYLAYMSMWLLYAFGELVDKTCEIEENTRKSAEPASLYEKLVELEELWAKGAITKEEYDIKRESIINP